MVAFRLALFLEFDYELLIESVGNFQQRRKGKVNVAFRNARNVGLTGAHGFGQLRFSHLTLFHDLGDLVVHSVGDDEQFSRRLRSWSWGTLGCAFGGAFSGAFGSVFGCASRGFLFHEAKYNTSDNRSVLLKGIDYAKSSFYCIEMTKISDEVPIRMGGPHCPKPLLTIQGTLSNKPCP
jgi:hypothetical protein